MSEPAGDLRKEYGPYEVESVLGRGAMGMVYLARDRRIGRKVALKTVHVDERFDDEEDSREFYKRLQREAELCGSLQHPNIVTLYEPGYDDGIIAWMATEYVDGESLRDRLKKQKPLPIAEAIRVAEDVLRGLAFAHAKGIIHRDIKPANILLTSAGEAKIADFGIARPADSNLTAVGEMLGTPSYMSPEQVKCTTVTARSDLFSVGAMLYEMTTGVKAFAAKDVSGILRNVVELQPPPAHMAHPQVPLALSRVIGRLLAKNPDERYASAAEALNELQSVRAQLPAAAPSAQESTPAGGLATLPGPRQAGPPERQPSITSVSMGDVTPAIGQTSPPNGFDREIPAALFFSVIAAVLLAFGAVAVTIHLRTDPSPTVTFSAADLERMREKREALAAARALYSAGEYDEAVQAYNTLLASYPTMLVAAEEREEAQTALEAEAKAASTKIAVTSKRPKKTPPPEPAEAQEEPPKRRSFWRRIFGRG